MITNALANSKTGYYVDLQSDIFITPNFGRPIRKTSKWKHTTYLPHIYTKEELEKFFTACDTMGRPYNNLECKLNEIELPILFRLLYSTGMRTTEVRLLRTENVDLSKGVIYISKDATKGYRERKVLVHDSMLEILRIYDKAVSALVPDRKVFFPNDHDGTHSDGWLSSHFSRIWKSAGNPAGVVAYDLRHNFIIERINSWTDDGYEIHSDLVTLSLYVGHSKLQKTYSYYAYVPRLGKTIEEKSGTKLDNIIPTIDYLSDEDYKKK